MNLVLFLESLVKKNFQVTTHQGKLVVFFSLFSHFLIFCLAHHV